eukprot:TRINITY_DN1881_c0_g5_i1.p1 TRINITY_DN1881_c0_g5~~TRINITY_DN1881_c0_g5_i1.p1  ORF type:complete len:646 (+),score=80.32 TRINITY_DN1881_c0_g5_i1:83-2020(+)
MITYDFGRWGVGFILQLEGSIFPYALALAVPNVVLMVGLGILIRGFSSETSGVSSSVSDAAKNSFSGVMMFWAAYSGCLAFLLIFRTQIAYGRFWEGGTLLLQIRGVWFNATSNMVAFCNEKESMQHDVHLFQHKLIRLMSMLYCSALHQVSGVGDDNFDIVGFEGFNDESLEHLLGARDRCEVIMQWIQRSIVQNMNAEVLKIAPPIASRVFQELSNGIVDLQNAKKITEFQFPFPYAQMITVMLLMHWIMTPLLAAIMIAPEQRVLGAIVVFISVLSLWSLNYTAAELEMPFGDDPNDLPITRLMLDFNSSLISLLNPLVQNPPAFSMSELGVHNCTSFNEMRCVRLSSQIVAQRSECEGENEALSEELSYCREVKPVVSDMEVMLLRDAKFVSPRAANGEQELPVCAKDPLFGPRSSLKDPMFTAFHQEPSIIDSEIPHALKKLARSEVQVNTASPRFLQDGVAEELTSTSPEDTTLLDEANTCGSRLQHMPGDDDIHRSMLTGDCLARSIRVSSRESLQSSRQSEKLCSQQGSSYRCGPVPVESPARSASPSLERPPFQDSPAGQRHLGDHSRQSGESLDSAQQPFAEGHLPLQNASSRTFGIAREKARQTMRACGDLGLAEEDPVSQWRASRRKADMSTP